MAALSSSIISKLVITFSLLLPLSSGGRAIHPSSATTEFIRVKCTTTKFPQLCVSSLSSYAPLIGESAVQLADAALNVTLKTARSTSAMMDKLSAGGGGRLPPKEAEALSDCAENLADSVDSLRESLKQMERIRGSDVRQRICDVQTWVSAALTDDNTCMDGFGRGGGKVAVRGWVLTLAHLTSNALSLISVLSPAHTALP